MGAIRDIPQPRILTRCKDAPITINEMDWTLGTSDSTALRSFYTNHVLNHTGQLDVLIVANDVDIPQATLTRNLSVGLVRLPNVCVAPSGRYYGFENFFKSVGAGYGMDIKRGLQTSTIGPALPDNFFVAPGKVLTIIVTNRFVGIKINNQLYTNVGQGWGVGPYQETATAYITGTGGGLPPAGYQFRWPGGQTRAIEQLVPMVRLGNANITARILGVRAGEPASLNFPVQP